MTQAELAAVAAALATVQQPADDAPAAPQRSAWALAMRHPDLDVEDLRALIAGRTCSPRFS